MFLFLSFIEGTIMALNAELITQLSEIAKRIDDNRSVADLRRVAIREVQNLFPKVERAPSKSRYLHTKENPIVVFPNDNRLH
jgi:hypothetical protein